MPKATQTSLSAGRAFRQGFLANLFNPKSVLFAGAVLVTVFPAGTGLADSIVIVANDFLVEIAFYTALAFGMSTQAVAKRYMRSKPQGVLGGKIKPRHAAHIPALKFPFICTRSY